METPSPAIEKAVLAAGPHPASWARALEGVPHERRELSFRCHSGRLIAGEWVGAPLLACLDAAGGPEEATHLLVESSDGYTACVSIPALTDAILALEKDGHADRPSLPRLIGGKIDVTRLVKRVTRITAIEIPPEVDPTDLEYFPE